MQSKKRPVVIDLFSGAGGFSKGFEMAGFDILIGIDNWEDAGRTFEYNHNNSKFLCSDISRISSQDIFNKIGKKLDIDVVIGGPPCQGFSMSGKRILNDERNSLVEHFCNLVLSLMPKVFVMENVQGLMSLGDGYYLNLIKQKFEGVYNIKYNVLNAADYGVPQQRKRLFIIGNRMNKVINFPTPTQTELNYNTIFDAISDLPILSDNLGEEEMDYLDEPKNEYQREMRKFSTKLFNHVGTQHCEKTIKMISLVPEGGNWKNIPSEYKVAQKFNARYTRLDSKNPSNTVDTGHRHHFHPFANRVPTVRENARFQSFPDNFRFLGSKTSQYKQVGNAVPPLLAKKIAKEIKQKLSD